MRPVLKHSESQQIPVVSSSPPFPQRAMNCILSFEMVTVLPSFSFFNPCSFHQESPTHLTLTNISSSACFPLPTKHTHSRASQRIKPTTPLPILNPHSSSQSKHSFVLYLHCFFSLSFFSYNSLWVLEKCILMAFRNYSLLD